MRRKATYTVSEIAERWNCSVNLVLAHIREGNLAAINIGSRPVRPTYVVAADELETFESNRTTRKAPPPEPRRPPRPRIPAAEATFR